MPTKVTIWHYPRCSKSRKTLAILRDEEAEITIRPYLDDHPDRETLSDVIARLGITARDLVRKKDKTFQDLNVDEEQLDDQGWLQLLVDNPALIQRPIVLTEDGAIIGRPPECVYEILPGGSQN